MLLKIDIILLVRQLEKSKLVNNNKFKEEFNLILI